MHKDSPCSIVYNSKVLALAGMALWIEHQPEKPQGHRFNSQVVHVPGFQARFPIGGM